MVTPNERMVLEITAEAGEQTTLGKLRSRMGLSTEILSITCKSLKSRGYIDLSQRGKVAITTKGLHAVGKRPLIWSFPYH